MKKTNRKSGFTLVELMIVAAIIAILAAIIIPLLTTNRDRAVAADGQNLLGTTATALKVYFATTGTTPTMALVKANDALLAEQLTKSKYFKEPTLITAVDASAGVFTYKLEAQLRAKTGSFDANATLWLDDTGDWAGDIGDDLKL